MVWALRKVIFRVRAEPNDHCWFQREDASPRILRSNWLLGSQVTDSVYGFRLFFYWFRTTSTASAYGFCLWILSTNPFTDSVYGFPLCYNISPIWRNVTQPCTIICCTLFPGLFWRTLHRRQVEVWNAVPPYIFQYYPDLNHHGSPLFL